MLKFLTNLFEEPRDYYTNWQTAEKTCGKYDAETVLTTYRDAALAVGQGDGVYDANGKVYKSFSENAHLVTTLQHVSKTKGHLKALNWGGTLGSMYRQHRWALDKFSDFIWCVVDKKRFVDMGKEKFTNNKLKFVPTVTEAVATYQPNIVVISNTLQRIEHPSDVLNELAQLNIPYLFIDQIPLIKSPTNRIACDTLSTINGQISFPVWHFSETDFRRTLQNQYNVVNEFELKTEEKDVRYISFFCEKK